MEVKAEQLLEELDNGVLLCQLIDVLQNTVKKCCSTNNLRVSFIMIFLKIQSPKSQVVVTGKAGEWGFPKKCFVCCVSRDRLTTNCLLC